MRQSEIELGAWINLSLVRGLRPAQYRALLSAFGLPSNILGASKTQLRRVVPDPVVDAISAHDREASSKQALLWAALPGNSIVTFADEDYPGQLL